MSLDFRCSELEHNFIKERISNVEKHFSDINSEVSSYLNDQARVRDSGDKLAMAILNFSNKEALNQTLRAALCEFSDLLTSIQEYREAQIRRTEVKVIFEFSNYNSICKQAKKDLKKCFEARAKELSKKNSLEKIRSKNPTNWEKIAQVEKEVSQAQDEASRTTRELSTHMDQFEKQKIEDVKRIFQEFIKIEMMFHCKAIEVYTKAFNVIKNIKTEDDLREFWSHFKTHTSNLDAECHRPFGDDSVKANADVNSSSPLTTFPPRTSSSKGAQGQQRSILNSSSPLTAVPPRTSSSKGAQGQQRSIFTQKMTPVRLENSTSSFDSALESKFQFGDHS